MASSPVSDDETIETGDIQGILLRGYGDLRSARFLVLQVLDAELARRYLQGLCDRLNLARDTPERCALQIAFTARGLAKLGVHESALATFSREFLEGMDDDVRADILGDRGDNDPSKWEWGRRNEPVDALLLVYAVDETVLDDQLKHERAQFAGAFHVRHDKHTRMLGERDHEKEHFGWRDGLSMPKFRGVPAERPKKKHQQTWTEPVAPGEFLLGYRNDYGAFTVCPTVDAVHDPRNHLALDSDGRKALGRNGTYLVYRELAQHVLELWDYLAKNSRESGDDPAARAIALGAKMVGRWPNGAPLVTSPDKDDLDHARDNEFLYDGDRVGVLCPRGSHIRRANPRDVLAVEDRGTAASLLMVRKHQMIRRGRTFGAPVSETMDPRAILAARDKPDREPRGLHFLCLVGNIDRQFEFVQRAWIHAANFDSLFRDGDPITAARHPDGHPNPNNEFTCPATPLRRKYKHLPKFTTLVGGGYFFLPGIAALRFISRHP